MKINSALTASIAIGVGAIVALAFPIAASAHVSITPFTATPGSYSLITFTVPNESASATTIRLEVDLPTATPFTSVSYVPVAGWTTELVTTTLPTPVTIDSNKLTEAVTKVIWTADAGAAIRSGQLQLFPLSVGAVPDTGTISLSATQTYSDGSVVKWDQSGADAEHPAPVLYVNTAPVASHDAAVTAQTIKANAPASTVSSSDLIARVFGIGGLVLGAVALVLVTVHGRRQASN